MKIPFLILESCFAVCEHNYSEKENEVFNSKLLELDSSSDDGLVHFDSHDELFFEGMTAEDKKRVLDEIKKYEE